MKIQNFEENIIKYEHECRKYRPAFLKLKNTINDKNIDPKTYFNTCYKYDLLDSFQAVAATALGFTNGTQFCGFFIRKFLEAYAVLFADKEGQFEETNYKLFKIMAQNREIGKRESDKLKKQFKIYSSKSLQDICEDNPYMFLIGATENQTTPFELLRNIKTTSKIEEQEKDQILDNYRFTSCLIHFIYEFNLSDQILNNIDDLYKAEIKAVKQYLRTDLKNNGKLGEPTQYNEIFKFHYEDIESELIKNSLHMLKLMLKNKLTSVFIPPLAYFINTVLSLDFWFVRKEYSYIMCIPKMFFEKAHIYFYLANLENYKEMQLRSNAYTYLVEQKVHMSHEDLLNNEQIDKNIHKIYNDYKKITDLKLNYYDFKRAITDQPAYLIYSKEKNYTDLAINFMSMTKEYFDYDTSYKLYKESVNYSHSLGKMIFKSEEEYYSKAFLIADIVFTSFEKYLALIKSHPVINLDRHSNEIIVDLGILEDIIKRFKLLYKTVSK